MKQKNRSSYAYKIQMPPSGKAPDLDNGALEGVENLTRKFLDIPYDTQSKRQKLDIYLPDSGDGPFPAIIFQHGGAFYAGTRDDGQANLVIQGLKHGYAVVCVGQRLAGETQFPYPLFDYKAAIRFLRANAKQYLLDADRFAAAGDSSGSYYAIFAAATQDNHMFEDLSQGNETFSSSVKAVVDWFGNCDMQTLGLEREALMSDPAHEKTEWDQLNSIIQEKMYGARATQLAGLMFFANPLNFITETFPPIYIFHGKADTVVPITQSYALAEVVSGICGKDRVVMDAVEDLEHADPRFCEGELQKKLFTFLDQHLK